MTRRVVVLDMEPGDVLVFRIEHEWNASDYRALCDMFKERLGITTLFMDSTIDMDSISAERVEAVRELWTNPQFKSALSHLASVAATRLETTKTWYCGIVVQATGTLAETVYCRRALDVYGDCDQHGHDVPMFDYKPNTFE